MVISNKEIFTPVAMTLCEVNSLRNESTYIRRTFILNKVIFL